MLRVLRILLILALAINQPAVAGQLMAKHDGGEHSKFAAMSGGMHHATQKTVARNFPHAPHCSEAGNHSASCGGCCAALATHYSFNAPAIPSLRPAPVQMSFVQPDLAAAIDPPRS